MPVHFHENTEFYRITEGRAVKISSPLKRVRHTVSVAPLKSVAISPFSFPFNNVLRIREALKLQVLPYSAAGGMELFPSIVEKTPRSSSGVTWFVPSADLESSTDSASQAPVPQADNKVWPAPLPLVAKIAGEGVTFWLDEENICSMLWRGGVPTLYRWKPRERATVESEHAWYEAYCKSRGEELGNVFALDAAQPSELSRFMDILKESLGLYPWIGDVNLSKSALNSAMVLERTVRILSRAASWVLVVGLLALAGNGLRYYTARQNIDALLDRSSDLYRSAFDPGRAGRIPNPLDLARSRMGELQSGTEGRSIIEVFSDLGNILEQNPSMDVKLDLVRYNLEGVDYTGSAPDTETAQDFRRAWADIAGTALIQNIHNVSGVGYRFDLSVKW